MITSTASFIAVLYFSLLTAVLSEERAAAATPASTGFALQSNLLALAAQVNGRSYIISFFVKVSYFY